ncbi:MAG: MbnP family protein [Bacteroidia bacterium]
MKKYILNSLLFLVLLSIVFLVSCKKSKDPAPNPFSKANFILKTYIDAEELTWNSLNYFNEAGNKYDVTTLKFYISDISLFNGNTKKYTSSNVFYIDGKDLTKISFSLDSIPIDTYTKIEFSLGLVPTKNKSYSLPSTLDNNNMAWPDMMGGGYHFLKFEGHYLDTASINKGFAVHLGENAFLPLISINSIMNQNDGDHSYTLKFNLNEVFKNPYTYDFNYEKSNTMSDSLAKQLIKNNITDAFSL